MPPGPLCTRMTPISRLGPPPALAASRPARGGWLVDQTVDLGDRPGTAAFTYLFGTLAIISCRPRRRLVFAVHLIDVADTLAEQKALIRSCAEMGLQFRH